MEESGVGDYSPSSLGDSVVTISWGHLHHYAETGLADAPEPARQDRVIADDTTAAATAGVRECGESEECLMFHIEIAGDLRPPNRAAVMRADGALEAMHATADVTVPFAELLGVDEAGTFGGKR